MRHYKCVKCSNKKKPCELILNHDEINTPSVCPITSDPAPWVKYNELVPEDVCEICGQPISLCKC